MGNNPSEEIASSKDKKFTQSIIGTKYRTVADIYLLTLVNDPGDILQYLSTRSSDFDRNYEWLAVKVSPGLKFEIIEIPAYIGCDEDDLFIKVEILSDHELGSDAEIRLYDLGGLGDQNERYEYSNSGEAFSFTLDGLFTKESPYFTSRTEILKEAVGLDFKIKAGTQFGRVGGLFIFDEEGWSLKFLDEEAKVNDKFFEKI
jgi:hypothetical protein